MSSEELKPCPFCGGDVSFHKDEECPGCHLIQCGQCRAFFDFATGADPGNDCASVGALRAAIAPMWNARADYAALETERDALAAELAAIKGQQVAFYWQDIGCPAPRKHGPYFGWPTPSALSNVGGRAVPVPLYALPTASEGGEV